MRRRALLATVGLLGAGCLDSASTAPNDSETATGSTGSTTPATTTTPPGTTNEPTTGPPSLAVQTCEPTTPTFDLADSAPDDAEYAVTAVRTSATYDVPEDRHWLEPDAFYSADAVEREREDSDDEIVVMDVENVEDPAVRDAIRTAIEDGEWHADALPAGLRSTVDRVDFFTGASTDGTYTHVGVELYHWPTDAPPAVEFGAAVADRYVSPGDPGALSLWIANAREEEYGVFSGSVPPFGMVRAERATGGGSEDDDSDLASGGDDRILLWRDYEEEGCFNRSDRGWIRCDIGRNTTIPPCESVAREYEILPSTTDHYPDETVPSYPGTYRHTDSLSYSRELGGISGTIEFTVEFDLEER